MELTSQFIRVKITSDKPNVDEYGPSNLISSCSAGFVSESFIRPPVTLTLDFPYPVEVAYILLETQVDSRKSNGFRIYSKTRNASNQLFNSPISSSNSPIPDLIEECASSTKVAATFNNIPVTSDSDVFFLGKWQFISENFVLLRNYHYKPNIDISLPFDEDLKSNYSYKGALRNKNVSAMKDITSLLITITSTDSIGPPVLKKIWIWGQPSFSIPLDQRKEIEWRYKENISKLFPKNDEKIPPDEQIIELESDKFGEANEPPYHIPDEFLDPLTCEIMIVPLLLPSGNSIDSSTLDKFIASEALWNRPPSDPFTGVPFKRTYRPEPNVALKNRIDRFVLIEKGLPKELQKNRGFTVADNVRGDLTLTSSCHSLNSQLGLNSSQTEFSATGQLSLSTINNKCFQAQEPSAVHFVAGPTRTESRSFEVEGTSKSFLPLCQKTLSSIQRIPDVINKKTANLSKIKSAGLVPRSSGSHSLVHSLGIAVRSTSQISVQSKKAKSEAGPSFAHCSSRSSYSLHDLASSKSQLKCPCGNTSSNNFYSLKCDHVICSSCAKALTEERRDALCLQCQSVTSRKALVRAHPKSAFGAS